MEPEPKSSTFPGAIRNLGAHAVCREERPGVASNLPGPPARAARAAPVNLKQVAKTPCQANGLLTVVSQLMPFQGFEREHLVAMVEAMRLRETAPGETVIVQGQEMAAFYIIESGKFVFWQDGVQVGQCRDMGHFSELALIYDCLSEHTVISSGKGHLWVLDRAVYRKVLHQLEQDQRIRVAALLETAPMLKQLKADQLAVLAKSFTTIRLEPTACILDNWSTASCFFIVEEGAVIVRVRPKSVPGQPLLPEQDMAVLGRGSYFGALTPPPSHLMEASVYAMSSVKCAVLGMDCLDRALGPCCSVLARNASLVEGSYQDIVSGSSELSFANLTL